MIRWFTENLFYFFLLITLAGCNTAGVYEISQKFHRPPSPSDSLQQSYTRQVYKELNIDSVNNTPDVYLKTHMDDGGLYVFRNSNIRNKAKEISGKAYYFNAKRQQEPLRQYTIGIDSIAIIESNKLITSAPFRGLMVFTGASLAMSGFCAARPKACFGSCPTFYSSGEDPQLKAEGFSSSFSPALERKDVDALTGVTSDDSRLQLTMKNEALETHVVRRADLLAVPTMSDSTRIYRSQNSGFWSIRQQFKPRDCQSGKGSCLEPLRNLDGREYTRTASDSSLLSSETLDLRFDLDSVRTDSLALVVAQRQSLITTFLFYQALDYMGPQVGEWFSMLERMAGDYRNQSFLGQLRGIKVRALTADSGWVTVGTIRERGPLASDVQLIPLPTDVRGNRIRLTMAQGNYRIDFANIVSLDQRISPRRIPPETVLHQGEPDSAARNALTSSDRTLTTMPGDEYRLRYRLPDHQSYTFFLESKGYYLEWMRPQWMKDAQPRKLSELIYNPRQALKNLAPRYKEIEPRMQEIFWNSRYATPNH